MHLANFRAAHKAFREEVVAELRKRAEGIEAGNDVDLHFKMPEPQDHTNDYDTAIAMVQWSVEGTVEITYYDFQKYVLDQWDWTRRFSETVNHYSAIR